MFSFLLFFSTQTACIGNKIEPNYVVRHSTLDRKGDIKEATLKYSSTKPYLTLVFAGAGLIGGLVAEDEEIMMGGLVGGLLYGVMMDMIVTPHWYVDSEEIYSCSNMRYTHKSTTDTMLKLGVMMDLKSQLNHSQTPFIKKRLADLGCKRVGDNPTKMQYIFNEMTKNE